MPSRAKLPHATAKQVAEISPLISVLPSISGVDTMGMFQCTSSTSGIPKKTFQQHRRRRKKYLWTSFWAIAVCAESIVHRKSFSPSSLALGSWADEMESLPNARECPQYLYYTLWHHLFPPSGCTNWWGTWRSVRSKGRFFEFATWVSSI